MPHSFQGNLNPVCSACGLHAHHLTEVILQEPCPVADASALDDLPPLPMEESVVLTDDQGENKESQPPAA